MQIAGQGLKKYKKKFTIRDFELFLMCIPALISIAIFKYLPMFGLVIAFKDYKFSKGIFGSAWVGLKNFRFFFTSQSMWNVTRNTILYNLAIIFFITAISVILALLLYQISQKILIKVYQTALFVPYFVSWVVVSYIAYAFLSESNGIANKILELLGMQTITWYSDIRVWPVILIFFGTWKSIGCSTVIYYSALMGIDSELFEAAELDGVSKFQAARYISIPFLKPIIIMMTLLSLGNIFYSDFGLFWFLPMDNGMLMPVTDVIDTYIYRSLRVLGDMGMSSAINFYQSFMGLTVVLIFNYIAKKVEKDSALF